MLKRTEEDLHSIKSFQAKLAAENGDLEEQVKAIKGILQENVDKVQETSRMLQLKTKECIARSEELEAVKGESGGLHQKLKDSIAECTQKSETIVGLRAQIELSSTSRASLEEELINVRSQLERVMGVNDTLAKEHSALHERVNELEHQLSLKDASDPESMDKDRRVGGQAICCPQGFLPTGNNVTSDM